MKIRKKRFKPSPLLLGIALLVVIVFIFLYQKYIKYSWSVFVANGPITSQILKYKNVLIFGSGLAKVTFVDFNNPNNTSEVDLNTGGAIPLQFWKDNVLVTSDDKLSLINIKSRKKVWEFVSENQSFFKNTQIFNDFVITGRTDGVISKINLKTGKLLWKFGTEPLQKLSTIAFDGGLNYFGNFVIANNKVYFVSQDQSLYILDLKSGAQLHQYKTGDTITMGPEVFGKMVIIGTKSGKTLAINKDKGSLIWTVSDDGLPICGHVLPFTDSDFPHKQLLWNIKHAILKKLGKEKLTFYSFHNDGTLVAQDLASGKLIWKSKKYGISTTCPTFWRATATFGTRSGNLAVLSLATGKVIFEKKDMGSIVSSVVISPHFAKILPAWLNIFSPDLIVNNTTGKIWMFDYFTGDKKWLFNVNAPTFNGFNIYDKYVLFAASDGAIYRFNKNTGKVQINLHDQQFSILRNVQKVANTDVQEFTLKSDQNFTNPWREADLVGTFVHESGKTIEIPGFYYDTNTWKIRFNPPIKGKWKWRITWIPRGRTLTKSGEFISLTDTSSFYIRKAKDKLIKATVDGKNIFNGLGLGASMYDSNLDGTFLNDWATGGSAPLVLENEGGSITYPSDTIVGLADYIATYGPKGAGFNIIRWSLLNASQPLYTNLNYPTTYSILQGKIGDNFASNLRKNDIHLWLTLFGFDIPFKDTNDPKARYLLTSYLRYMYARYGAYVDVWELANEVSIPTDTAIYLGNELRSMDYEKRMVSVSSTGYNFKESDIIAPHWYESEKIFDSDIRTYQKIHDVLWYEKPIVFAEQGNINANYDSTSAIRMRVRTWTAFFNQAILMFWNQSDTKNFKAGIFPGNIYLGEEERGYTKVLQNLTNNFPVDSVPIQYGLEKYGVRGYGLSSSTMNAAYFYHFASPFTNTNIAVNVYTVSGGKVTWIDPASGKVVQENYCPPGYCNLITPTFKTDTALFIK